MSPRKLVPLMLLAVLTVAAACDAPTDPNASTGPQASSSVTAVTPVQLTGVVRVEVSPAPTVIVKDPRGRPITGAQVQFQVVGGGGTLTRPLAETDAAGRATSGWVLGSVAGVDNRITARVLGMGPVVFSAVAAPGPLAQIVADSGDLQEGEPGSALPQRLSAKVSDAYGNPLVGLTVSFEVISGGGSLEARTAVADASGKVSAGTWTLGPSTGEQRVRATATGRAVEFTAFGCPFELTSATCDGPPQLAFVNFTDRQIYTMRMDSSGLRRLTSESQNVRPAWSPDRQRIAFARYDRNGDADIYLMDANGSHVVRRTTGGGFLSATWSPDGRKLAVSSEGVYDSDIWVIPAVDDGTRPVHLVSSARAPAWSPDGTRIAYVWVSGDDGYSGLHVMNADGTGDRELIFSDAGIAGRPSWSPDGTRIAFGKCDGGCDLFTIAADGSDLRQLTMVGMVQEVAWSPSADWIAVTLWQYDAGRPSVRLAFVPVDGGSLRLGVSAGMQPAWRPLPSLP